MIINCNGATFEHDGVTYTIGAPIIGTDQSEYEGLTDIYTKFEMALTRKRRMRHRTYIATLTRRMTRLRSQNWRRSFRTSMTSPRHWRT